MVYQLHYTLYFAENEQFFENNRYMHMNGNNCISFREVKTDSSFD